MNEAATILKRLVEAQDEVERAHDVESWEGLPKCGLYPLEQIAAIQKAESEWMAATKQAKDFLDNQPSH